MSELAARWKTVSKRASAKSRVQGLPLQHVELAEVEAIVALQVLDVLDPAQVEVIDAPDLLAALDQRVAEVAADESRSAGN